MTKAKGIISDLDSKQTFKEKYEEALNLIDKMNDPEIVNALEDYLETMREYQVSIIQRIKEGDEDAFEELLKVKDIRNFIYYYAYHIRKFFNFSYKETDIVSEIRFQIYYTIKQNYRIYNQPNEISLLINSMRRWIKQKVGSELKDVYSPKDDNYLPHLSIEDTSYDGSEKWIREVARKHLSLEDQEIFERRFFGDETFYDISVKVGKSQDAIIRRYRRVLKTFKKNIWRYKEWQ